MEIICSWCGKKIGEKDGKGCAGVTSTICEKCKQKILNEITKEKNCKI